METQDMNPNTFADLFTSKDVQTNTQTPLKFGMQETNTDMFPDKIQTPDNQDIVKTPEEVNNKDEEDLVKKALEESNKEVDILNPDLDRKKEEEKPLEFSQMSQFFEQSVKDGKFVAINSIDDKGNSIPFVPKTANEFYEAVELQVDHKLQSAKKDLDKSWYEEKSPAWQAVSKYAEMVDDPTQLIPFLQGVRTIQSVVNINEEEIDGAEEIIRTHLEQTGTPEVAIDSQIESLKSTDKLISTAKVYKPVIIQNEQRFLAQQVKEREIEEQQRISFVNNIKEKAFNAIEEKTFGKQKLKQDEKRVIYDLLAQPEKQTKGYKIYNAIDDLYDKGDFETLTEIALILANKKAFLEYLGTDIANKTAAGLQRKLQVADSPRTGGNGGSIEEKVSIKRQTGFTNQVRFGSGQ